MSPANMELPPRPFPSTRRETPSSSEPPIRRTIPPPSMHTEPRYIASSAPSLSCFFMPNCVNLPPASGYLTEVNPTGTGLVYSSYFSGTQTDTINFAAFTPNAIYLGGNAGSANLPGFAEYPQQCLPQMYETRLSPDAREIGPSRLVPSKLLAYDAFAATLIATNGTNVIAVDPNATQTPIACILDAADLKPVTSIAPGELLSMFGEFSSGSPTTPPPGQVSSTTLDGATVTVNGVPSPLLYVGGSRSTSRPRLELPARHKRTSSLLLLSRRSPIRSRYRLYPATQRCF